MNRTTSSNYNLVLKPTIIDYSSPSINLFQDSHLTNKNQIKKDASTNTNSIASIERFNKNVSRKLVYFETDFLSSPDVHQEIVSLRNEN